MVKMFLQLLVALIFAALCADQAKKRGRNPMVWFCLGALFNLLALVAVWLLPSYAELEEGTENNRDSRQSLSSSVSEKSETNLSSDQPYMGDPRCRQWFFLEGSGVTQGPVAFRNIHTAWDKKQLSAESLVWTEGMNEWMPIRAIPALMERLQLFS